MRIPHSVMARPSAHFLICRRGRGCIYSQHRGVCSYSERDLRGVPRTYGCNYLGGSIPNPPELTVLDAPHAVRVSAFIPCWRLVAVPTPWVLRTKHFVAMCGTFSGELACHCLRGALGFLNLVSLNPPNTDVLKPVKTWMGYFATFN
uniref:Uncharacterized protein n=1 Tax=Trypanosoma congolense (strain IL3000) TaxID=1068625 RepID=G0UZY1_TRYCI|nr:hypothetical protein, unlikely [Trypanosoma congolense IL3000]